jgi:DNA-binding transcriptional ArsR family regulator
MEKQIAVAALAALAQETRLEVFRLLVRAGAAGLTPGAIAKSLDLPAPTLSFHLKELKGAGLVAVRREGRSLRYAPDFGAMRRLVGYLSENCCQGVSTTDARKRRT